MQKKSLSPEGTDYVDPFTLQVLASSTKPSHGENNTKSSNSAPPDRPENTTPTRLATLLPMCVQLRSIAQVQSKICTYNIAAVIGKTSLAFVFLAFPSI